ncbi:MAG TPA: hypothetical protein EYP10_11505, partial [Armatimonadetes bacterium]|nr:hypothetical protein [Armatimonadota bacterium]
MHKTKALSTVVLAMFVCCSCLTQGEKINVPERYRRLYGQLEAILDAFDADLLNRWDGRPHATIFAAELLPANAHRGDALLRKNAMAGIRIYLDRLR